jgi:hypothetical protein
MSEWPMVKLGEVCSISIGKTPARKEPRYWGEGLPWLSIKDMNQGSLILKTTESISQIALDELKITPYSVGTVLFSFKLSIGKVGITAVPLFTNEAIAAIEPKEQKALNKYYLMEVLREVGKTVEGNAAVMGVTLNKKSLAKLTIPLPPLGEQKRIAEILGGASKAINEIRTEIKRVESLCGAVVSLYAEDQSTKKLEDLATLSGGLSLGSHRKNKPHSVGYLRVANVFWGKILYDEIKELNCTDQEFERTLLQDGDVLITEAHANRFQVGRSAVFRGEEQALVFQNHLFRARPNKNIDSDVLAAMLSSVAVRRQLYQMAKTTSGLNTISISQVRSLRVPVLDTTKQAELLSFLQESNKLNHLLHRKLSLLQELQKSLATRAFAGLL